MTSSFITQKPIFPDAFLLLKPAACCGALATFFGIARNHHNGRAVKRLHYECYTPMANKEIRKIREAALERWELADIRVLHRVGTLGIGDTAVAVAVSSAHRAEAFAACEFIVEEIKHRVPIWKKETFEDGTSEWVLCAHGAQVVG